MPQLAFFPWAQLAHDMDAGGYSLRRFKRGEGPGASAEQDTLDAVLAPYRDQANESIREAVILVPEGRGLMEDLSEAENTEMFRFAELFAFASLSAREFFSHDYFNRDNVRLVIQKFEDPRDGAAWEVRRRDGQERPWWPGEDYVVQVPAHVSGGGTGIEADRALLEALRKLRESDVRTALYRGIRLFNQANTDASDVSPGTELILAYAAIVRILKLKKSEERRFPSKFADAWRPCGDVPRSEWQRFPKDGSCKETTLRGCWAADLYKCRGNLAHGHQEAQMPSQWTVREHLLLTSFAVPQLVKNRLSNMRVYDLTHKDKRDINAFERLLNLPDLFGRSGPENGEPWRQRGDWAWRSVLEDEDDRLSIEEGWRALRASREGQQE